MATTPAEAKPADSGPGILSQAAELIQRFGLVFAAAAAAVASAVTFWQENSPLVRTSVVIIAAVALATIAFAKVLLPYIESRRRQKVISIPEDRPLDPKFFRLRPYDEADHATFDRPDGAHDEALRWLQRADEPFLYLTGFSGTGKSSLLHAWLKPELAKADPPVTTVLVRSFADPLGQLVEALARPGAIWPKSPPSRDDPRRLIERAAERVRPGRLLVAIDQFEECLILQDEPARERLAALFASLRDTPVPGLQLLVVMRTDYFDLDELRRLGLPEVRSDGNWFNLNALSRADARAFLKGSGLSLPERLREDVLDEASEVDDLPGLIRPITLNMLGLVLQRFRDGALKGTAPGKLIQDYLRQSIAKPGIDELAPRLLKPMITDKGTKRPTDEAELARATGTEPGLVRKCLLLLARDGLVRELERERHVWEISHDFVARQLGQIIPRLRPSWLRRARSTLAPAALAAWLVLLPLVAFATPEVMSWYAQKVLAEEGVRTPWDKNLQGYHADFSSANPGAFGRLHGYLEWLHPVRALTLAYDQEARDLPPFPDLQELKSLTISGNDALQALPELAGLGALTQLTISFNRALEALPELAGLGALTQLSIWNNPALQALPELAGLTQLQEVRLAGSFVPEALSQLRALPNLRRAMLPDDEGVRTGARSVNAERARNGLAAIEFRFEQPGSRAWYVSWDQ